MFPEHSAAPHRGQKPASRVWRDWGPWAGKASARETHSSVIHLLLLLGSLAQTCVDLWGKKDKDTAQ